MIKRIFLFLLIMLSFYGCKKEIMEINKPERARIEIKFSSHCTKTIISPIGGVVWKSGDVIHVYHSVDGYLGSLSIDANYDDEHPTNAANFTGTIYEWKNPGKLSFYYMGIHQPEIVSETEVKPIKIDYTNQMSNVFSNETDDLDRIASNYQIAVYSVNVNEVITNFSGVMKNLMALGYFNTSNFNDNTNVKLYSNENLNTLLTIGPTGEVAYSVAGISENSNLDKQSGYILLGKATQGKYIALLPKNETEPATVRFILTSNSLEGEDVIDRQIKPSGFVNAGGNSPTAVEITASPVVNDYEDIISPNAVHLKKFTVYSKDNEVKKVVFSQGNLVYDQGRFKVHKKQYSYLPSSTYAEPGKVNGIYDRFGWATSGWNNRNLLFSPYTRSNYVGGEYNSTNGYGYGPYNGTSYGQSIHPDVNGTNPYRFSDWGNYQFGMGYSTQTSDGHYWRLLGDNEWATLFTRTDNNSRKLFGYATITQTELGNVKGVILLPDDWDDDDFTTLGITFNYGCMSFNKNPNVFTLTEWEDIEEYGAIFLPFAGYSNGVGDDVIVNPDEGYYWGAKHKNADKSGCFVMTTSKHAITGMFRYYGCFVRLVYETDGLIWK